MTQKTYIDKDYPWSGILAATALSICSAENGLKGYSSGQLLFFRDMILLIKRMADWKLIGHKKKAKMHKYNIHKNSKRVDHRYKAGDKVMINNITDFKYETPYNGPFEITQC